MHALIIVDDSYRYGPGEPSPMLGLDDFILRSIAMLLLPQIVRVKADALLLPDQPSTLRRVVRDLAGWMQANLDRPIQLTELEQRCAYGRRALQQGFKAEFGCGPIQWLRLQRLERALEQFQNPAPGLTVGHVAQACGYSNLASFSRDFRERFGLTASEMLRMELFKQQQH
jgi:transcriptional regulator GlxA family with amidase domain